MKYVKDDHLTRFNHKTGMSFRGGTGRNPGLGSAHLAYHVHKSEINHHHHHHHHPGLGLGM